jgi:hypothetical protein
MFPMRGNFHVPGGKARVEPLPFDFFHNLNTAKIKRRLARRIGNSIKRKSTGLMANAAASEIGKGG